MGAAGRAVTALLARLAPGCRGNGRSPSGPAAVPPGSRARGLPPRPPLGSPLPGCALGRPWGLHRRKFLVSFMSRFMPAPFAAGSAKKGRKKGGWGEGGAASAFRKSGKLFFLFGHFSPGQDAPVPGPAAPPAPQRPPAPPARTHPWRGRAGPRRSAGSGSGGRSGAAQRHVGPALPPAGQPGACSRPARPRGRGGSRAGTAPGARGEAGERSLRPGRGRARRDALRTGAGRVTAPGSPALPARGGGGTAGAAGSCSGEGDAAGLGCGGWVAALPGSRSLEPGIGTSPPLLAGRRPSPMQSFAPPD